MVRRGIYRRKPVFNGFTIIELLIVISIIGLLATIAFVAYGSSRTRAEATKVVSDLQAIEQAFKLWGYENGTAGWWLEWNLGSGTPGPTMATVIANNPGFATYMAAAPTYKGNQFMYDHDGDSDIPPSKTACQAEPRYGVNIMVVDPNPSANLALRTEIDKIVDGGDGFSCGLIQYHTGTTQLIYQMGVNAADF